jgi:hypothetical protein
MSNLARRLSQVSVILWIASTIVFFVCFAFQPDWKLLALAIFSLVLVVLAVFLDKENPTEFPVSDPNDIAFLSMCYECTVSETTLPSGLFVPKPPPGKQWRAHRGKITLVEADNEPRGSLGLDKEGNLR